MTGPFTAPPDGGELVERLLDVHRALILITAAAHMAANHRDDLIDVGQTADAIEQLARETAARVWALQENLPYEISSWEPDDEPPADDSPATSDAPARPLRAVPTPERAS